jgi:SNF2 family DNA or RNA helicase
MFKMERCLVALDMLGLCWLQGVLYGLTRKGRVLIADEMGVGKTVQALAMAACYQVILLRRACSTQLHMSSLLRKGLERKPASMLSSLPAASIFAALQEEPTVRLGGVPSYGCRACAVTANSSLHVKPCLPSAMQEEWPLLIIVPASLRLVWAEEIERWLPHIRPGDVTVIEGKDDRSASTATTALYLASHMHWCCCHHCVWLCFKLGALQGCMCGGVSLHHQAIGLIDMPMVGA